VIRIAAATAARTTAGSRPTQANPHVDRRTEQREQGRLDQELEGHFTAAGPDRHAQRRTLLSLLLLITNATFTKEINVA
jgi:hypothetical protein